MICPYCSNEMEKARLIGARNGDLSWQPFSEKLPFFNRADARLLKTQVVTYSRTYAEAFVCEDCGKLITEI